MKIFRTSTAILALAALSLSQVAEAKSAKTCITEPEVVGMLAFSMPSLLEGVATKCREHLSDNGFIATSSDAMIARYSAGQDEAWPMARAAFLKFGDGEESREIIEFLSDDALKPLVYETIGNVALTKLKPNQCADAERLIAAAANIAPQDLANLFGAILVIAAGPNDKKMPICERD